MATPIVAGAAAVLLQKNPTWTPDQVKFALRSTAIDLGKSPIEQGYGRIDLLAAANLQEPPIVQELLTSGTLVGSVDVTGNIIASNFQKYRLEYGVGKNPTSYTLLVESITRIKE